MSEPTDSITAALVVESSTEELAATVTRLEAALEKVAADADRQYGREVEKQRQDHHHELLKSYLDVRHEVTKAAIDRSRDSAKFVQTASAAIAGLYTGLLTLVFSTESKALPLRGVYATVFLGLSVAGSTAYLAFLRRGRRVRVYDSAYAPEATALSRADHLTRWVNASVLRSSWILRAAVVALAVGVALIPAAFVGGVPKSAAENPAAPTIPERVPGAIADEAATLFERQVDDYLASLDVTPTTVPPIVYAHDGPTSIVHDDSWLTGDRLVGGDKLERNFFWLAFWGIVAVAVLPTLWSMAEQLSRLEYWFFTQRMPRHHPEQWVTAANATWAVFAVGLTVGIALGHAALTGFIIVTAIVTVLALVYMFGVTNERSRSVG